MNEKDPDNIKIILLNCPYEQWADPDTQYYFGKFIETKLAGYNAKYEGDVLPLTAYDFIANLILIGEQTINGFRVLAVFKSITLAQCIRFNLPFEFSEVLKKSNHGPSIDSLADLLKRYEGNEARIAYNSSWTIHPELREQPELKAKIRELSSATLANYYSSRELAVITAAAVKFKVDHILAEGGFSPVLHQGRELEPFAASFLNSERARMMYAEKFSTQWLQLAWKHQRLWNNRLETGRTQVASAGKVAA